MFSKLPLTLESRITIEDAACLLDGREEWGSVRLLWSHALRRRRPIRTHATLLGIELPDPDPQTWRREFCECFLCRMNQWDLQLHHIERRGQVHCEREDWPENWMLVCGSCHRGPLATMPHAKQLAYKWIADAAGHATLDSFLDRWLRIKDADLKAPQRVTVAEVQAEIARINT